MRRSLSIILIISVLLIGFPMLTNCKLSGPVKNTEDISKEKGTAENKTGEDTEIAVFGGGCFWSMEAIFSQLKGIVEVEAGYAGGHVENPTYEQVYSDETGHAEVVKIEFDPKIISYGQLLDIFFYVHDPTTLNRQGNDIGESYRSILLFTKPEQEKSAKEFIKDLDEEKIHPDPVVTEVEPLGKYYSAESYHQEYYDNNSTQPYCEFVISPKIDNFQKKFADLLK